MLKFRKILQRINSPYQDFWLRLVAAVIAAHLIVSHGYGFFKVLIIPGYLISLLGSFLIALLLFVLVNVVTVFLDRHMTWQKSFVQRIVVQLMAGTVFIIAIAYVLAERLFVYMGDKIEETDYMQYDFYFICLYVAMINVYYYVRFMLNRKALYKAELYYLKNYHKIYALKQEPRDLVDVDLAAFDIDHTTIACICSIKGSFRVYNMKGEYTVITTRVGETISQLPKGDYFTINRYFTLHRILIFGVQEATSRRVGLVLRAPFDDLIPNERKKVSQGLTDAFLKGY